MRSRYSAGAHLASLAALARVDLDIRGVIAVSGAALDLTDEQTYQLGADRNYYRQRCQGNEPSDEWKHRASPALVAKPKASPFLILYATGETKPLQRQSQVLHDAYSRPAPRAGSCRCPAKATRGTQPTTGRPCPRCRRQRRTSTGRLT